MAGNYDSVLEQLRAAGLVVDRLQVGKRARVRTIDDRERRGWYHLHELRLDDGEIVLVGAYGVWRGDDPGTQKVLIERRRLSDEQRLAIRQRMTADRKAAEQERQREASRAAKRASAMWGRLSEEGDSEYLRRKGVGAYGARFSGTGAMVLPMLDVHGRIHGLQIIYPADHPRRKRLGRDKDFWPPGLQKQGHFFLIGSPAATGLVVVVEGYATGATVHAATGLPVAVAYDAGNLVHVSTALRSRWRKLRILIGADDDYLGRCRECRQYTLTAVTDCAHCGKPAGLRNAGISGAEAAALAVQGSIVTPRFSVERPTDAKGPTDWNDLHLAEGLHVARAQIEAHLAAIGWSLAGGQPGPRAAPGEGGGALRAVASLDELLRRFTLVYELADVVFDAEEHKLVPLSAMRNICVSRELHREWMEHPDKRIVRTEEVGFDPGESDPGVLCNLWGGWPATPKPGICEKLLLLGEYLCSRDERGAEMWDWLLKWIAYPIQHPGAKMKTAVVMHGPQGTGKNLFWESVVQVYGEYGRVIGQDAVEDKFNDWASRKLFIVADEVVARDEMYHSKNRLKVLVTSDKIRINPKNLASYYEVNHVNLAFLSNEVMPMALERDDRRYAVIWTPEKWDAKLYNEVIAEQRAGGIEAFHDYLLNLPLGDFGPATLPPMTDAKLDLIELGMDSSERFLRLWIAAELPLPVTTARTEDLYNAYRYWCGQQGVQKPAQLSTCVGTWSKREGIRKARERHYRNTTIVQSTVLHPPTAEIGLRAQELTTVIDEFADSVRDWKSRGMTT